MSLDAQALGALIEQSEDLQRDAMRATCEPLAGLTEHGRERRAGWCVGAPHCDHGSS